MSSGLHHWIFWTFTEDLGREDFCPTSKAPERGAQQSVWAFKQAFFNAIFSTNLNLNLGNNVGLTAGRRKQAREHSRSKGQVRNPNAFSKVKFNALLVVH
jgi:hypothetical protein